MIRRILVVSVVCLLLCAPGLMAQADNEPYYPPASAEAPAAHPDIQSHQTLIKMYNQGRLSMDDLRRKGLSVFSTPFTPRDGLGDGPFDVAETEPGQLGQRPTLQTRQVFLRINGLDAQSCNECHTIVDNSTRPPTLGLGGVGGNVQNAMAGPSMFDVADSSDDRVAFAAGHTPDLPLKFDGVADYNGRFINPPFLFGGGGVELLGKEMTRNLQEALAIAESSAAGTTVDLFTHGVGFGYLVSEGGGEVNFDSVEGVDHDLVVRPFGRKGEAFSMRDFDRAAMQFHLGVQPVEVVGKDVDADGDGMVNEVTVGEMTALHIFDVNNPRPGDPQHEQGFKNGLKLFRETGCATCHMPRLITEARAVPLASPEVAHDPDANVYLRVPLKRAGFETVEGGGVAVPLFADLKRHDMGDLLAETFEFAGISNREFTTARLWGVADTAPYLHDGRAPTLYQAIWFHGGEAQEARDVFLGMRAAEQRKLINFLGLLHTPDRPNEDLLPLY